MKRLIYILLLCFAFNIGLSQNQQKIDSLLQTLETTRDDTLKVKILYKLSQRYCSSSPDKALQYGKQGLKLAEKLEFKNGIAICLNNIGVAYYYQGNYEKTTHYFLQSLKINEELGDKQGIAGSLDNIANVFRIQGNYVKSLSYSLQSLIIFEELDDRLGMATCLINIGVSYYYQNNFMKSLDYYKQSLNIYKELEDDYGVSKCLDNIGIIYRNLGNYEKALHHFLQSLEMLEKLGDRSGISACLSNIGKLHLFQGNYEKALIYNTKSLTIAEEIGAQDQIKNAYENIAEAYAKQYEFEKAYEYYKLFAEKKDSLFNIESSRQIAEMQTKYETRKKDEKNELLARENEIKNLQLNQKNYLIYGLTGVLCFIIIVAFLLLRQNKLKAKQRATELEQRALRTQMNPHFIFNSLNSIQKFFMESNHEKANEYLADFGGLMRMILANSSKQQITIADEVSALKLYLSLEKARLEDMLNYEIKIDEGIDEHHTFMPPLVIQPFVENAIWHGIVPKKTPGKVMISLKTENNHLICTVEDDGIGIEKSVQLKKQDDKKHEPMGMKVTGERVEKVKVEALEEGTKITIHIPIT